MVSSFIHVFDVNWLISGAWIVSGRSRITPQLSLILKCIDFSTNQAVQTKQNKTETKFVHTILPRVAHSQDDLWG